MPSTVYCDRVTCKHNRLGYGHFKVDGEPSRCVREYSVELRKGKCVNYEKKEKKTQPTEQKVKVGVSHNYE